MGGTGSSPSAGEAACRAGQGSGRQNSLVLCSSQGKSLDAWSTLPPQRIFDVLHGRGGGTILKRPADYCWSRCQAALSMKRFDRYLNHFAGRRTTRSFLTPRPPIGEMDPTEQSPRAARSRDAKDGRREESPSIST